MASISAAQGGVLLVMALMFAALCIVGVKHYNGCKSIQGTAKYENRKIFLNQCLTIMIAVPATVLATKKGGLFDMISGSGKSAAGPLTIVMGVLGLVASIFLHQLLKPAECNPKKSDQTYAKAGIGLSVIAILAGAAFTFVISGKGAYANSARAAVAGVTPASQTLIAQ
jgi:hypothetical protein|tara:strand:+ start:897 stop:1403 length:507 start_codon:yes stop_codon:yes gene_type:complete